MGSTPADVMFTKAEVQRLRSLCEKRQREAQGLYVVEGEKVVAELLDARVPFEEIYGTSAWTGTRTAEISEAEMARISHFPTPSNVLAVGRIRRRSLGAGELDRGLTLVLDGVQDPGNVGILLRVADWYAFDRVVLSPDSADLFSQKVINSSKGSFGRVCVYTHALANALAGVRAPVLGLDPSGENVHGMAPLHDAVLVIGGEGRGLSPAVRAAVSRFITIPRLGGAESLNAAVVAAIICDNLRRNGNGA